MNPEGRTYIAIDLKSFYASVECVERGLDPLDTNLVVADVSRTEKTICLAVTPTLKQYGISGRARLFEVVQAVREVNYTRLSQSAEGIFHGRSTLDSELQAHPDWEVDYIAAPPRMAHYIKMSARIYDIYLKYIAPEDIHIYSIDEVFMDVTAYLASYRMTAHELTLTIIRDVLCQTGITATAGIGTNMYLCKVAMDIVAKKMPADSDGVRIAELDEQGYRRQLWNHRPLTSFWRVGRGIARRLQALGIETMGQLARRSLSDEDLLYKTFGVNAELLIDHAWGYEPCTIDLVKAYRPESNSFSNSQVLAEPYESGEARIVALEMADNMALKLVAKGLVADQVVFSVDYDAGNLQREGFGEKYASQVVSDYYGRAVPKGAHGSAHLPQPTSSSRLISRAVADIYDSVVNPDFLVRRLTIAVAHVISESAVRQPSRQLSLFGDTEIPAQETTLDTEAVERERRLQQVQVQLKERFGNNVILKGLNFAEGATARQRNQQIGGHKA